MRDSDPVVIIDNVPHAPEYLVAGITSHPVQRVSNKVRAGSSPEPFAASGQVAQVVERSPEKAGVGGSTPSLATIIPKDIIRTRLAAASPLSVRIQES